MKKEDQERRRAKKRGEPLISFYPNEIRKPFDKQKELMKLAGTNSNVTIIMVRYTEKKREEKGDIIFIDLCRRK